MKVNALVSLGKGVVPFLPDKYVMFLRAGYGCDPLLLCEDASQNTSYLTKMCGHDVSVIGTQGETEYVILLKDIRLNVTKR